MNGIYGMALVYESLIPVNKLENTFLSVGTVTMQDSEGELNLDFNETCSSCKKAEDGYDYFRGAVSSPTVSPPLPRSGNAMKDVSSFPTRCRKFSVPSCWAMVSQSEPNSCSRTAAARCINRLSIMLSDSMIPILRKFTRNTSIARMKPLYR